MDTKITYAIFGIIAAVGLITAVTLSAANSAFAGVPFTDKQGCLKFYKDLYKQGSITKEQYKNDKEFCRNNF